MGSGGESISRPDNATTTSPTAASSFRLVVAPSTVGGKLRALTLIIVVAVSDKPDKSVTSKIN